jgi:hypothetical protein
VEHGYADFRARREATVWQRLNRILLVLLIIAIWLVIVSLFVPIIAGLWARRVAAPEVLAAIAAGVAIATAVHLGNHRLPLAGMTAAMWGLLASGLATLIVLFVRRNPETSR